MSESNERAVHGGLGDRTTDTAASRTVLHGLVGGITAVLLSFLPLSTVLGGAVAGYLEGPDYVGGAKVGTIAGIVALVPAALVGLSVLFLPVALPGSFTVSLLPIVVLGLVYTVGFGVLGGALGAFVRAERSK